MKIQVINAPANEETLLRKHVSLFAHERNICCGNIFCFRETNNVSDFSRNILFPHQMFPHLCAEETMLTGFCGRLGCISLTERLHKRLFSAKRFLVYLRSRATFWEAMFPRLRGPLQRGELWCTLILVIFHIDCFSLSVGLLDGVLLTQKTYSSRIPFD